MLSHNDVTAFRKNMWIYDIENAIDSFLYHIGKKFDQLDIELKAEHQYPVMMVSITAVLYFKLVELYIANQPPPVAPSGKVVPYTESIESLHSMAREGLADFYLIPESAVSIPNLDERGYCRDLVRVFSWKNGHSQ